MADLRIVLQLPNEDELMDIDDYDLNAGGESNQEVDQQGQRSFSTIGGGIMAFNEMPSPLDITTPEELLTPLARLRSVTISENIFNRRMIAYDACNILDSVANDESDFNAAVQCYLRLSEDLEPSVRVELMEQVSEITERFGTRVLDSAVVPILLRYLTDVNNQVRKTCHCVLVDITKRGFLSVEKFEEEILPTLKELTSRTQAPDECRTEAIALTCQICEAFGAEFAKQHFLPIFLESCRDETIFHVRKVCAANFSAFCNLFDDSLIAKDLLLRFTELCKDNVWGVRKSCAENFPDFAKHTSEEIRIHTLSPIYSSLLADQSRWVRVAAFESLGPFISTFADTKNAGDRLNPSSSEQNLVKPGNTGTKDGVVNSDFDSFLFWRDPIPPVTFDEDFDDLTVFEDSAKDDKEDDSLEGNEIQTQVYVNSSKSDTQKVEEIQITETAIRPEDSAENIRSITKEQEGNNIFSTTNEDVLKSAESSAEKENIPINFVIELKESGLTEAQDNTTLVEHDANQDNFASSRSLARGNCRGNSMEEITTDLDADFEWNQVAAEEAYLAGGDFSDKQHQEEKNQGESGDDIVDQDFGESNDFFDENEPKNWQSPDLHGYPELYDSDSNSRCEIDYRIFSSSLSDISYARTDHMRDCFVVPSSSPKPSFHQDVIPQHLLDNFLSMTDPTRRQTVDSEIAKHCAFSLPGVAYTLGRNNWHCLKDVYQKLASDVQWKVRRTIASSIHELAKILGEELTATELVPVFNGFLKDLDDVRIGVLRHLADFLKLLRPDVRGIYLRQLTDFLTIDNNKNWRFRYELARQLCSLVELYDSSDIVKYICPISMCLATDRIVAVQGEVARLMAALLAKLHDSSDNSEENHFKIFASEIISRVASSPKWKERALFSKMCDVILREVFLPFSTFLHHFSAPLVQLAGDKIVNVRILAAKVISFAVNTFCEEGEGEELSTALTELQNDKDRDVRFFAKS